MPDPSALLDFRQSKPEQLRTAIAHFLPKTGTHAERVAAIETVLRGLAGQSMRNAMAEWIVDGIVPVSRLVPEAYLKWRPPVRDAMMFVVARLSPARLAPKLLEQFDLPENTSAEVRLLRLIAKVPGLQKLGQVIARNRHLRPALRNALARLENGIRDVKPEEMIRIIERELGPPLKRYDVRIDGTLLSEASVSAVMRFTWRNPESARRERGVFKVLKPHIPEYFAEDMAYLQGLAEYFSDHHQNYGLPAHLIPDTFKKVRRLLRHEVNFVREQKTLLEAWNLYRNLSGVRIPRLIQPLCTRTITALTQERGIKVTNAAMRLPPARRRQVAEQLIEALVAYPLFSSQQDVIFHGDPHAGNLLYDNRTGELTIIDWALRERLSREQRRHLALLFAMVGLRDRVGACDEVLALSQRRIRATSLRGKVVSETVGRFFDELPAAHLPSMVDVMRLLELLAMKSVRFPGSLIILSKVMFTLDGILTDIGGMSSNIGFAIARQLAGHWRSDRHAFRSPLTAKDWVTLQCSALLYTTRLWMRCEELLLDRLMPSPSAKSAASA
jgi:ubiquinone biosynthesis protein